MDDKDTAALTVRQARAKAGGIILAARNGYDLRESERQERDMPEMRTAAQAWANQSRSPTVGQ